MSDAAKGFLIVVGILFGVIILGTAISWFSTGNALAMYEYFAPKQAAAENKVFHESAAFTDGMQQELSAFHLEYVKGNKDVQEMITSDVLHRYAAFPESQIKDEDLQKWFHSLKVKRGLATE
jgi:hypothetical protein